MSFTKLYKDPASLTKLIQASKGFDTLLHQLKILSVDNGSLQAEIKVSEEHTNPMGGLHGGFSSLLVDSVSSFALMSRITGPHVSVDIHMSYLKGGKVGDDLLIDVQTLRCGKTLAFLEVLIKNKATGDLLVKGSHTKYIVPQKS